MAKKLIIESEVKTDQIDKAAKKLGELKDLGKGLKIQYDIDGKPLDIVIDKSLNLQKQARILVSELRRTKEGTAEFQLLSARLGDVQDGLDRTKVKSGDLFTSLQLLPGPVGQFASQVNGAISALKVFSGFSLKDLKFQFKETIDDFKNIASGIAKATGITKAYTVINDFLAASFIKVGVAEGVATAGARAFAAALTATGVGLLVVGLGFLVSKLIEVGDEADVTAGKVAKLNVEFSKSEKDAKLLGEQRIAQLKAEGATEAQIYADKKRRKEDEIELARNAFKQFQTQMDAAEILEGKSSQGYKDALKGRKDAEEKLKQAKSDLIVMGYNEEERLRKENEDREKKAKDQQVAKSKEAQDKIIADTKTYYEKIRELADENEILLAKNEDDAAIKKIKQQERKDIEEIKNLKLKDKVINGIVVTAEQQRADAIEKIQKNSKLKISEIIFKSYDGEVKKQEETVEATNQLNKKARDYRVDLVKNEFERNKQKLENQAKDEIDSIKKSKANAEAKANAIKAVEEKLASDLDKLKKDTEVKEGEDRLKRLDDELKFLQITNEASKNSFISYWQGRKDILVTAKKRELEDIDLLLKKGEINLEESEKRKSAIEKKYAQSFKELQKEKLNAYLGYLSAGLSALSNIAGQQQQINSLAQQNELDAVGNNAEAQDKIKEKFFYKNRTAQYNQALISAFQSAISAYSSLAVIPVVGPALGAVAAGAALIFGKKQADLIRTQKYQGSGSGGGAEAPKPPMANFGRNYEKGGMIGGRRHAEGGTLIEAEKGEAIMTRGAVSLFGPMLSLMNQAGGGTSFNSNLITTRQDNPVLSNPTQEQSPLIVKTYVVSQELTTEAQKQARLKNLSTL